MGIMFFMIKANDSCSKLKSTMTSSLINGESLLTGAGRGKNPFIFYLVNPISLFKRLSRFIYSINTDHLIYFGQPQVSDRLYSKGCWLFQPPPGGIRVHGITKETLRLAPRLTATVQ